MREARRRARTAPEPRMGADVVSMLARALIVAGALALGACAHRGEPTAAASCVSADEGRAYARSTVDLTLDGQPTRIDVYRPCAATRSAVILAHGFSRSRSTMAGHANTLAREGLLAVAPDLPYFFDTLSNARALADLVARLRSGNFAPPVDRVVLIGFSAGGLSALLASGSDGVVGYIGLDPFDRASHVGRAFAPSLRVPAALLRGPPSACNAYAAAAPWAQALSGIEVDRVFENASHCDFEAPTDWLCRLVCGAEEHDRQIAIREQLLGVVRRWLRPTPRE